MNESNRSETGLAEGRWLWRRLYVFVASTGLGACWHGLWGGQRPPTCRVWPRD